MLFEVASKNSVHQTPIKGFHASTLNFLDYLFNLVL
jgi:hypothetical protein